ncbi:acyl-CoA thioesterase [Aquincola sp. S2]|uniref:Acyl-CoA thioesterase n=1 Tax=Pseudaquabacterium terrae TaxID=2732868 RepID=A0ABX2EPZ2_9BURK|nr:thioesterase family protein [Aquabacterium terrae]NRF70612.1 acyl-CoA thioesterase [Aquabacterium terrae]
MSGRFERAQRIRFSHCDPAGIVFFPSYFVLFNGLVEDWVSDALGIPYAALIGERRIGLPTVSLQTGFRAISRMGDAVRLGLEVERLGLRSFTLALDCCGADGAQRVQAQQVIVTTDLDSHRAVEIPEDLRAAIERFRQRP